MPNHILERREQLTVAMYVQLFPDDPANSSFLIYLLIFTSTGAIIGP